MGPSTDKTEGRSRKSSIASNPLKISSGMEKLQIGPRRKLILPDKTTSCSPGQVSRDSSDANGEAAGSFINPFTKKPYRQQVPVAANVSIFHPPFLFALTPQPIPYYHFPFSRNFVNFLHTNNAHHIQCINKFK